MINYPGKLLFISNWIPALWQAFLTTSTSCIMHLWPSVWQYIICSWTEPVTERESRLLQWQFSLQTRWSRKKRKEEIDSNLEAKKIRWYLRLHALLTDLDFFRMRNLHSRDLDLKVAQGRRRNEKATSRDITLNSGRRGANQHTTENWKPHC